MSNTFCQECGTGIESQTESGMVVRMPTGFPYENPCQTCEREETDRMREIGKWIALAMEERFLQMVFNKWLK